MSKIGKKSIAIPSGVDVQIENQTVKVVGPKGTLSYTLLSGVSAKVEDNTIVISIGSDEIKNLWGLSRTLVSNMVHGVSEWYEKKLLLMGVGFSAKKEGDGILFALGFSHKIKFDIPPSLQCDVEQDAKGNYIITLRGIDKQYLWEVTAKIKALKKPEPYKGKGIRYFGEVIKLKAGKTAKK